MGFLERLRQEEAEDCCRLALGRHHGLAAVVLDHCWLALHRDKWLPAVRRFGRALTVLRRGVVLHQRHPNVAGEVQAVDR